METKFETEEIRIERIRMKKPEQEKLEGKQKSYMRYAAGNK